MILLFRIFICVSGIIMWSCQFMLWHERQPIAFPTKYCILTLAFACKHAHIPFWLQALNNLAGLVCFVFTEDYVSSHIYHLKQELHIVLHAYWYAIFKGYTLLVDSVLLSEVPWTMFSCNKGRIQAPHADNMFILLQLLSGFVCQIYKIGSELVPQGCCCACTQFQQIIDLNVILSFKKR